MLIYQGGLCPAKVLITLLKGRSKLRQTPRGGHDRWEHK